MSLTSIIILTWNELEHTRACLDSIRRHTTGTPYEVIFVDNGSTDGTVAWLREQSALDPLCQVIENSANLGFARGCNQGIMAAAGMRFVLLNNDTIVTPDWLTGMSELLDRYPDAGIIGPMTNSASGIQVLPDPGYRNLDELPLWAKAFREKQRYRIISQRRIVGFCMLFRRELVEKTGLLDEEFGSGNFEDDDYCLRAELAGYRNMIAGDVFVHHVGGATFSGNRIGFSQAMFNNRQLFNKKWAPGNLDEATLRRWVILIAIEEADRNFQKGLLNEAVEILIQKGIKADSSCSKPYIALTGMLIASGQYDLALHVLTEFPADTGSSRAELEALCHAASGDDDTAAQAAERALSGAGKFPRSLAVLGTLAVRRGETGEAETFFRQAIDADPSCGCAWLSLGMLLWSQGRHEDAWQAVSRSVVVVPLYDEAVTIFRDMAERLGRLDDAMAIIATSAGLYPDCRNLALNNAEMLAQCGHEVRSLEACENFLIRFGVDDALLSLALGLRSRTGLYDRLPEAGRQSISLCMIVRDEELNLPRCLASIRAAVHEMIVIDTGSLDRTREIATVFGAIIYDFTWNGDFSAVRNAAIEKAGGFWIFAIDADEVLSAADRNLLGTLMTEQSLPLAGWSVLTRNYSDHAEFEGWTANDGRYPAEEAASGWFPSRKVRLFPNDSRFRFSGEIHEMVEPALRAAGIPIREASFIVHHYGELAADDRKTEKKQRYYETGKRKLSEYPDDVPALTELAIQAAELELFDDALELWERVLRLAPRSRDAYFNRGGVLMKLGRFHDALASSQIALEIDPAHKEAAFNAATCELFVGDPARCVADMKRLLQTYPAYPLAKVLLAAGLLAEERQDDALPLLDDLKHAGYDVLSYLTGHADSLNSAGRFMLAARMLLPEVCTRYRANGL